jgi:hypothetical protein
MPDRAVHVMSLVRQASGGRDYDARFGHRQSGRGAYADMISQRFAAAGRRFGVATGRHRQALDCKQFRKPGAHQQSLDFS